MRLLKNGAQLLMAVGLLMTFGAQVSAQTSGRLLLANGTGTGTGSCLWASVDQFGLFSTDTHAAAGSPCLYGAADTFVPTDVGILAYDSRKGSTWVIRHDAIGENVVSSGPIFSPGWTWLVTVGNFVFLYDGKSNGAIVRVDPGEAVTQTYSITHVSPWTNVTAISNYLVFYNSQTGAYAVAIIDNTGRLHQTASSSTKVGFTNIATSGDALFFYNRTSGEYLYGAIVGFSNAAGAANYDLYTGSTGSIPAGYTHLASVSNNLVLYNVLNGAAQVMSLPDSGLPVPTTQTLALAPYWQSVVSAANHLFFYNVGSGAVAIGDIDRTGKLTVTPQETLSNGFFNVVATHQ